MNGVLRLAALLLILYGVKSAIGSFAFAQDPSSVSFVGRWRSLETSKGGIGQFCDFRPDGKVDFGVGADVEMPWRIENGQLILPSETNGGPERKASLKWFGRNRIHIEGGAAPIELVRVGDPINPNDPLLGEWIENRDMGGQKLIARYLFYPNGKLLLLIPIRMEHGTYSISGSTIRLKRSGKESISKFWLDSGLLTFSAAEDAQVTHFARY